METCYAVHEFAAENPDEISFRPGEAILVLEKDDQYGDGWWQGRNAAGDVGLFPRDYTSSTRPTAASAADEAPAAREPVLIATMTDIQHAIDQIDPSSASPRVDGDASLLRSGDGVGRADVDLDDEDDGEGEDLPSTMPEAFAHDSARARLAASARSQLASSAVPSPSRTADAKPFPQLELSDESDDDASDAASVASAGRTGSLARARCSTQHAAATPLSDRPRSDAEHPHDPRHTPTAHPENAVAAVPRGTAHTGSESEAHARSLKSGPKSSPLLDAAAESQSIGAGGTTRLGAAASTSTYGPDVQASSGGPTNGALRRSLEASAGHAAATSVLATAPVAVAPSASPSQVQPVHWTVDQVVEWGRLRGFDQLTLDKLAEHEITGDVLLDLDVATMKEIDLHAFGRRKHLHNAIVELRNQSLARPPRASDLTLNGSSSPNMSGYEPDTPSSRHFSPRDSTNMPADRRGSTDSSATGYGRVPASATDTAEGPLQRSSTVTSAQAGRMSSDEQGSSTTRAPLGLGLGGQRSASPAAPQTSAVDTFVDRDVASHAAGAATGPDALLEEVSEEVAEQAEADGTSAGSRAAFRSAARAQRPKGSPDSPPSPEVLRRGSRTDKGSFFGTSLRARKAPPRVVSGTSDSDRESKSSRRSTRLFGFGTPQTGGSPTTTAAKPVISAPLEATNAEPQHTADDRTPIVVGRASVSPPPTPARPAEGGTGGGALLDQIGTPELDGWLKKKAERYSQWKSRYMVLKGRHLYAMKSQHERRVKGWIDLVGYKVLPDPDSSRGSYGFKLVHTSKATHYFSSEDPVGVRRWMKALMKSSITRDYTAPVLSSNNIATIPLAEAQAMFPPPRPPSPTSRARAQQLRLQGSNPNTLSPKDAEILMSLQKPGVPIAPPRSGKRASRTPSATLPSVGADRSDASGDRQSIPVALAPGPADVARASTAEDTALVAYVNAHLPAGIGPATDLTSSMRSGHRLLRLAEHLSGRSKGIPDARFQAAAPDSDDQLDLAFDVFDFLTLDLALDTADVSVGELLRGDGAQIGKLVASLRTAYGA